MQMSVFDIFNQDADGVRVVLIIGSLLLFALLVVFVIAAVSGFRK